MVRVKICGITNLEDAQAALEAGADALGFVFFQGSPRRVTAGEAREIISALPPLVTTVGVFVDEEASRIKQVVAEAGLHVVQFHGDEPPGACDIGLKAIKAVRVKDLSSLEPIGEYRVSAYVLDTYCPDELGGTGRTFNWDIALEAKRYGRVILAGGLTPDNVERAVRHVMPYAVDVSSGVEREKGRKDHEKLRLFIKRAKGA